MPDRAVIFDMDGVIVDSEQYWHKYTEQIYIDMLPDNRDYGGVWKQVTGMNYREIYDFLRQEYGAEITKDEFIQRYNEIAETIYNDDVSLMDGFTDIVASLSVPVALASSSPRKWIDHVLNRFELHDKFALTLSADEIDAKSKPQPDIYLTAANRLNVEPKKCIAVEDSPNGIMAAKQANMTCIAYRSDSNEDEDLSHADTVVTSPSNLKNKLQTRLNQ